MTKVEIEFLNSICKPLINYFEKKKDFISDVDFYYLSNSDIDKDLLNRTHNLWETMDADLYSCSFEDFLKNASEDTREYLEYLIDIVDVSLIKKDTLNPIEESFFTEYRTNLKKIENKTIKSWKEIEDALFYWRNAISDSLLEDSLLFLKLVYLYKKAEEQLGLPFPDKLKSEIHNIFL
jgi:hypothetical protein